MRKEHWVLLLILLSLVLCVLLILNGLEIHRSITGLALDSLESISDKYVRELRGCSGGGHIRMDSLQACMDRLQQREAEYLQYIVLEDQEGTEIIRTSDGELGEPAIEVRRILHRRLPGYSVNFGFHEDLLGQWQHLGRRASSIATLLGLAFILFGGLASYALIKNIRLSETVMRSRHLGEVGIMVAQLSHEIRNPLASIRGLAQILEEEVREPELKNHVATIISETSRLDLLARDLLSFSRPARPVPEKLNVTDETQKIIADLGIIHETILECPSEPCAGRMDPSHFRQIMENLLMNACDATKGTSPVEVKIQEQGKYIITEVTNRAENVQASDLDSFFTPFYTTKSGGSGLGLSVCKKLAEANGAILHAELKAEEFVSLTLRIRHE
ncbi:MAG TPA: histidine kinase dimerization/phospho-acceptor domain-containing protein [Thermoanaerobaculia bacterium]|nr:histidine kinase dimerization/phospho-acceptor domain-containing protein [Thermoanaerobaculia bacterium]HXK66944.1 histidine kinase dimerization/phospho-acceptor domain-containing protein [Thermoanaerobaculia bacterium]